MRHLLVAFAVIEKAGKFYFQQRGTDPRIGGAGLIGCFGGKIEAGETPLQAVCRELAEETTLVVVPNKLTRLGEILVESDHNLEAVTVGITAFKVILEQDQTFQSKESGLVAMTLKEALAQKHTLTTGTRACLEQLM